MEEINMDESKKWSEEDLLKLPYKKLKKLARQMNVNPNSKKAYLVKALRSLPTSINSLESKENNTSGRMTRSRASVFILSKNPQNNIDIQEAVSKTNTPISKSMLDKSIEIVQESNHTRKKRGNRVAKHNMQDNVTSDKVETLVCNMQASIEPLVKITNIEVLQNSEPISVTGNKEMNKSKKMKVQKIISQDASNIDQVALATSCNIRLNHCESEDEKLCFPYIIVSNIEVKKEKKMKRQARKMKEMEKNCRAAKENKHLAVIESTVNLKEEHTMQENKVQVENKLSSCKSDINLKCDDQENNIESIKSGNNSVLDSSVDCTKECVLRKSRRSKNLKSEIARNNIENNVNKANLQELTEYENISEVSSSTMQSISSETDNNKYLEKSSNSRKRKSDPEINVKNLTMALSDHYVCLNVTSGEDKSAKTHKELNNTYEPENMPGAPVRSSTFILDELNNTYEPENMPGAPVRSSTFILDDNNCEKRSNSGVENQFNLPTQSNTFTFVKDYDKSSSTGCSLRFTPDPVLQNETSLQTPHKIEKSIGKRVLSSMKQGGIKPLTKQSSGSTLKKTITKNTTTTNTGSMYRNKFGMAKKLPNFKTIHQKLFNNMESLGDNQRRKLERAQALMQSPVVPRCAFASPTGKQINKSANLSFKKEMLSKGRLSSVPSPMIATAKTAAPNQNVLPKRAVNRFGFQNRIKKVDAKSIVGNKLPPVNLEKKKKQERSLLQSVRMNRRFELQMQMRQNQ